MILLNFGEEGPPTTWWQVQETVEAAGATFHGDPPTHTLNGR